MVNPFAAKTANNTTPAQAENSSEQGGGQAFTPPKNLADMFSNGTQSGGDKLQDLEGTAVLIKAIKFEPQLQTQHGPTDAVQAEWVALDGERQGETFEGLIFGSVIVRSLASNLNAGKNLTVGVVEKGTAKPGRSAPWLLGALDDEQLELAGQAVGSLGWG